MSLMGLSPSNSDREFTLLEVHVELDIAGFEDTDEMDEVTGIALPYIVTICKDTREVLGIRRNYAEQDPLRKKDRVFHALQIFTRIRVLWFWSYPYDWRGN